MQCDCKPSNSPRGQHFCHFPTENVIKLWRRNLVTCQSILYVFSLAKSSVWSMCGKMLVFTHSWCCRVPREWMMCCGIIFSSHFCSNTLRLQCYLGFWGVFLHFSSSGEHKHIYICPYLFPELFLIDRPAILVCLPRQLRLLFFHHHRCRCYV